MIADFEILKKQLTELAKVVNSFKSEAVQLKVTELVLTGQVLPASDEELPKDPKHSKKAKKKVKKAKKDKKAKAARRAGRVGPAVILTELIGEGYFKQARMIGDIIKYVEHNKARQFKASDLSGTLARFVQDGRLKRGKNKDGQYEYKQP